MKHPGPGQLTRSGVFFCDIANSSVLSRHHRKHKVIETINKYIIKINLMDKLQSNKLLRYN